MKKHIKKLRKLAGNLTTLEGLFFLIIGVFMAMGASFLIVPQIFVATDIEKILSEENLIAFVSADDFQAPEYFSEKYPETKQKFSDFFSSALGAQFSSLDAWRGEKVGMAFYSNDNGYDWIALLEVDNKESASSFLLKDLQSTKTEETFFPKNRNIKCAFYDKYLSCTNKNSQLLSSLNQEKKTISSSNDFQRWSAQVPKKCYFKTFFVIKELEKFIPKQATEFSTSLKTGGMVVVENENSFESSVFFIKKEKDEDLNKKNEEKYLASFVPDDTVFFLNGKNSSETINLALNELRNKDIILGKIRAFLGDEFFGDDISLEDDIFPLFAKDFLLILAKEGDSFSPLLVLDTNDRIFAEQKKEKFVKGFEKMSAQYGANILENENEISEVFPENGVLEKNTNNFLNAEISYLQLNLYDKKREIAIAQDKNILFFAENPTLIKKFLENMNTEQHKLIPAEIMEKFPFKTFSYYDEILAFSSDFLPFLGEGAEKKLYFLDQFSLKLVRIPDSFRIDVEVGF